MPISRAKNLTDESIHEIVELLDGWSNSKLTWDLLIEEIKKKLKVEYTRQALSNHERILRAYQDRKKTLGENSEKSNTGGTGNKNLDEALEKNRTLNATVQRLQAENNRLLEQFILWRFNASVKGISMEYLSQPLSAPLDSSSDKAIPKRILKESAKKK